MIKQYKLHVVDKSGKGLKFSNAYNFYGMLMESLDYGYGSVLHEQSNVSMNQYLVPVKGKSEAIWTVNLLDEDAIGVFSKILDNLKSFYIKSIDSDISIISMEQKVLTDEAALISYARNAFDTNRYTIKFNTPTSFKSANEYMIFPSINHIVNSLVNKWNAYSGYYIIDDEEAVDMIVSGLRIVDYRLRSSVFLLKGNRIPGFLGEVQLYSRLPYSLNEIWNILAYFSSYSGVEIKASLGMGGINIS